jgi:putative ABC transport system permease protein
VPRQTPRPSIGLLSRVYAVTLSAFPRRHREAYTGEMIDAFERALTARRREHGPGPAAWFAVAACLNAIGAGLGERLRQRHRSFRRTAGDGWLGVSWIDVTLAWRMFVRYPGLSIAGVFGLAVGIATAAGAFTLVSGLLHPELPLPEGDRVVAIRTVDVSTHNVESRVMHDLAAWRALSSLEDFGASVTVGRTLIAEGGHPETITAAQMTSSGFRLARVSPERGRYLLPEDERPGAPDVVVIGHDVWRRRFGGDPNVLGRTLELGSTTHAIVGVMPEGFGFPIFHDYWIPWRLDPEAHVPRTGPSVTVFGRLAPGATLERAQAELTPIVERTAAASPGTHRHLRAYVEPYALALTGVSNPESALALHVLQLAIVMLLVIVCVNVAILVYARTATRQGEIAVRTALGASRRRIVTQLFVEALVLAGVAAAAGIAILAFALDRLDAALRNLAGGLPFWMTLELSAKGVMYAGGLALLAAAIVGVVPALKATGRRVQTRLQRLSAGSGANMHMGRLWTLLIIAQVGFTVALLPAAMYHAWQSFRFQIGNRSAVSQEMLRTRLVLDQFTGRQPGEAGEAADRELGRAYARRQVELEQRLEREPGVSGVTFALAAVGEELAAVLDVEGREPPIDPVNYNIVEGTKQGHLVRFNRVVPDFFGVFDMPLLMGRTLREGDDGVVVNQSMVVSQFGGANPLGRRIRYVGRSREAGEGNVVLDRWYEVIGVVADVPEARTLGAPPVSLVYHAAAPGDVKAPLLAVRMRGRTPSSFAGRLREICASVDPDLQLRDLASVDEIADRERDVMRMIGLTVSIVMLSVVMLSGAGIYALMSFTVARRRREIGIRAALGGNSTRILAGVFSRVAGQLTIGALCGMLGAVTLEQFLEGEMFQGQGAIMLPIVAIFMTTVGLAAAFVPARRGVRIPPTEALRED